MENGSPRARPRGDTIRHGRILMEKQTTMKAKEEGR